jgi:predicted acetyltransferase
VGLHIRPITADELVSYLALLEAAAGRRLSDSVLADARVACQLDRTLAAFDGDRMVGGTGSDLLELTVPGPATVPAARITITGVLPSHRRRGVATALMVRQLHDLRERGEPLAVFTTSGPGIYRRIGYSPATAALEVEVETAHAVLDVPPEPAGSVRLFDDDEAAAALPEVFDRHRRSQPGQVSRTPTFWQQWFLDRDRYRKGEPGDRFAVVFEDLDGSNQGYLTYRFRYGAPRDQPVQALVIEDLVSVTEEARRALWAYALTLQQAAVVTAHNLPVDEPLVWMLSDPRRLQVTRVREFLWLRLVDIPAALGARRYAAYDALVLQVADPVTSDGVRRYRLETGPDEATCSPTSAAPDLALGVTDLAAGYLGGATFTTLARAQRVTELTPGALERADALFTSRPAPWTVSDW